MRKFSIAKGSIWNPMEERMDFLINGIQTNGQSEGK